MPIPMRMPLRTPADDDSRPYDPREGEDWFLRLPASVQARVVGAWQRQRAALGGHPRRVRLRVRRCARESALLLAVIGLSANVFLIRSFTSVLALLAGGAALGAGIGAVLAVANRGRFGAASLGLAGYVILRCGTLGVSLDMLSLICLFCGAWITLLVYGIYGVRLEFRGLAHSGEA